LEERAEGGGELEGDVGAFHGGVGACVGAAFVEA
jgi:hypothetical protein